MDDIQQDNYFLFQFIILNHIIHQISIIKMSHHIL